MLAVLVAVADEAEADEADEAEAEGGEAVSAKLSAAQKRELVLWVLVVLCQLGYPVGPMLKGAGIPIPLGDAHAAHDAEECPGFDEGMLEGWTD